MADKEFVFGALPTEPKPTTPPPAGKIWAYGNFADPNATPGTNEYASSYKNRWVLVDKPIEGVSVGVTGEVGTPTGRRKDVWSSGTPGVGVRKMYTEFFTPSGGTEWRSDEVGGVTELVQEDARVAALNLSGSGSYNSPLLSNGEPYTGDVRGKYYVNGIWYGDTAVLKYKGQITESGNVITAAEAAAAATAKASGTSDSSVTNTLLKQLIEQQNEVRLQQEQYQLLQQQERQAEQVQKSENAYANIYSKFKQYGLESLAKTIRDLAISGANESTITLQLQETPEYKLRFKANEQRLKNNLQVLDPETYLRMEDNYRQMLRNYGLKQFDTDAYISQFIANDTSEFELTNRINAAVQRVRNADPAITQTLRNYYGIGETDLVSYILDPSQDINKILRQVSSAEIGAAAGLQGIKTGVDVAEQLVAQGIGKEEAQKGYATIAERLPTAEKLSQIYGKTLESYGLSEAEQDVFNTLASAQRKRRKLTEREIAAFSGESGLGRTSLNQQIGGQI